MKVLIAGIGNIFLGDDGFGSAVAHRLASGPLPQGVEVVDFGVRSLHLAYELLNAPDLLVLVDAMSRGSAPGTLYLLEPDTSATTGRQHPTAHSMDLVTTFGMLRELGGCVPATLLVGCEPEDLSEGLGLSATVEKVIPTAAELVMRAVGEQHPKATPQKGALP